jgi:hypothetical protein
MIKKPKKIRGGLNVDLSEAHRVGYNKGLDDMTKYIKSVLEELKGIWDDTLDEAILVNEIDQAIKELEDDT